MYTQLMLPSGLDGSLTVDLAFGGLLMQTVATTAAGPTVMAAATARAASMMAKQQAPLQLLAATGWQHCATQMSALSWWASVLRLM
jgi:hypothetical protein